MLFAKIAAVTFLAVAAAGAATHAVVEAGPAVTAVTHAEHSVELPPVALARLEP